MRNRKSDILSYNNKVIDELYNVNTLVNVMKSCYQDKEFRGEYYGIPHNYVCNISNERNENLSMLRIIADKLKYINKLSLSLEESISELHKNADNRRRQIAAECADNKRS